jgi:hypothetical protein
MAKETDMTEGDVVVSRRAVEKVMPADKVDAVVKHASSGDRGCLQDVKVLLADPECGEDFRTGFGSSAEWLRRSLIKNSAGKNILAQESIAQENGYGPEGVGGAEPDVGGGSPSKDGTSTIYRLPRLIGRRNDPD